jgi:hypothetical protein
MMGSPFPSRAISYQLPGHFKPSFAFNNVPLGLQPVVLLYSPEDSVELV